MDLNVIVLSGELAAEPEIRTLESGSSLARLLVAVRSTEPRRRVDVIPVVLWDPDDADIKGLVDSRRKRIHVTGSVQRRFWSARDGKTSRIEVIAHTIDVGVDGSAASQEQPAV